MLAALTVCAIAYAGVSSAYRFRHVLFGYHTSPEYQASDAEAPISIELNDAPRATTSTQRVALWLKHHRAEIVDAGKNARIDCYAIAGTIAFEALDDPMWTTLDGFARWSGPGKVHFKEHYAAEGNPVAKQVEDLGYLPRLNVEERRRRLSTVRGATAYIGAIMRAFADAGNLGGADISKRAGVLATLYSGWNIDDAQAYFRTHHHTTSHELGATAMGAWVDRNSAFLRSAVGPCRT
jgi:hypothetical protein